MRRTQPITFGQLLFQAGMQTRSVVNRFTTTDSSDRGFNCREIAEQGIVDIADVRDHWVYVPRWSRIYRCMNVENGGVLIPHSASGDGVNAGPNLEFWLFRDTPLTLATAMVRTLAENTRLFSVYRDVELDIRDVRTTLAAGLGDTGSWRYLGDRLRIRIEGVELVEAVYAGSARESYLVDGQIGYRITDFEFDSETKELSLPQFQPGGLGVDTLTARCRMSTLSAAQILDMDVLSREWHDTYLGSFTVVGEPYEGGLTPDAVIYICNLIEESYLGIAKHGMSNDDALVAQRHQTSARNRAFRGGSTVKKRF